MLRKSLVVVLGAMALVLVSAVSAGVAHLITKSVLLAQTPPPVEAAVGMIVPLDEFLTNLFEPGAHVRVKFALVVAGEPQKQRLEKNRAVLRDAVVQELRQQRLADLRGAQGAEKLAQDVLARATGLLGRDAVLRVLVTDIVTQP